MAERSTIMVGDKDVDPTTPSHVPGVHEGNWPLRSRVRQRSHGRDPVLAGHPRRSTGIASKLHGTIDPRMPKLTPP